MEQTLARQHTTPLPGLEHPSWPGQTIPAVLDGHTPPTWCVHCDQLAGQIRACERLGDRDGMVAYGRVAILHWFAIHESDGVRPLQTSAYRRCAMSPQVLYGQREDALTVWEQRTPDSPHRRFEDAGETVIERDRELAEWFLADAARREFELAEYRAKKQVGD